LRVWFHQKELFLRHSATRSLPISIPTTGGENANNGSNFWFLPRSRREVSPALRAKTRRVRILGATTGHARGGRRLRCSRAGGGRSRGRRRGRPGIRRVARRRIAR